MIVITDIIKNSDGGWTFTWTDDGQSFSRVILWGIQLAQTTSLSYVWTGQEYREYPPPLEIAYENQKVLSEKYKPQLVIQWYGESVIEYLVQQKIGSTYKTIVKIQDTNKWMYTWKTAILTDETLYDYQVVAVDNLGNQSVPRKFERYIVCPPIPPDGLVSIDYQNPNILITNKN